MQDNNLNYVGTGSRTNYEQVILNYHETWSSDPIYTGRCCSGSSDIRPGTSYNPFFGIFYHQWLNVSSDFYDNRLCSRLSKVP